MCQDGERHLAILLKKLMYLVRYSMTAVNKIQVRQHYLIPGTRFEHEATMWEDLLVGINSQTLTGQGFLQSQSVLLLDKENDLSLLNLSPFLIDGYHWKFPEPTLYLFSHLQNSQLVYKRVSQPTETVQVSQEDQPELYEQMNAYSQDFFGRSLSEFSPKK